MARTMAMGRTMATRMTRRCCLPAHSDGTYLPVRRYGGGILDDLRPAASPPPPPPPPFYYYGCAAYPPAVYSPPISPCQKYVDMGLLRPFRLPLEFSEEEGGRRIQDDAPPAQRWWEVKYKKPWRLPPSGTFGITDDDDPPPPPPPLSMVGSNSNWEGRLKRARFGHTSGPYPKDRVQDVVANRLLTISLYFKVPKRSYDVEIDSLEPEQFEYSLDEVQGYSEFMDLAHELHSIDRLYPLLHHVLVYPRAACIRAKTAELVATMVHNNPRSQQLVMGLQGLQPLWYNFTSDPDTTSRTKALGAISALIRNNKPGITAFRETNGYAALGDALSSENVWFQREALNLIQYLLQENSSDFITITELGLPRIMIHLASSDDAEVRVAALRGLLVLARDEEGTYEKKRDKEGGNNNGQLVKNDDKLKHVLQELIKRMNAMASEDLGAATEEIQLVDSLWNACFNEPSSLKLFELLLRTWAAGNWKLLIETLLKRKLHFF